jgi:hypothetical protein
MNAVHDGTSNKQSSSPPRVRPAMWRNGPLVISSILTIAAIVALASTCSAPRWSGALPPRVVPSDRCGTGAVTSHGAPLVHRLPYLQSVTTTGASVVWAGVPDPAQYVVVTLEDDGQRRPIGRFAAVHPEPERARERRAALAAKLNEADEPLEPGDYYALVAEVTGIAGDTRYCYRVESANAKITDWALLRTAPSAGAKRVVRFAVLGDSGTGSAAQHAIARRVSAFELDAILFAGDIAYPAGTHAELQSHFFDVYAEIFRRTPVYAAIGNHEQRSDGARPFEQVFVLPGNERWYSFDWGDVHFVVLDTNQIGQAQASWLEGNLAANPARFRVVLGHHPPVTSARRGPSRAYQQWFVPILERHRVELVISGHEHHYERSVPIRDVTYVVTGGGGADLYPVAAESHTHYSQVVHHFVVLEVEGREMKVRAIDIDGGTIDQLTLTR